MMCAATVTCVGLTGDGQCVLVNTLANCLYLIDKTTGELLNEYVVTAHSVCVKLIFLPESDAIKMSLMTIARAAKMIIAYVCHFFQHGSVA